MKKRNITALSLLLTLGAFAQQPSITLDEVLKQAELHYPSLQQKGLLQQAGEENQRLLQAQLYPQFEVKGQATYQSEVTSLEIPGFPSGEGQKPDNYNVGVAMKFPLTTFGIVKTRQELEAAQTNLQLSQVDVEAQKLRERLTALVGNMNLQQENLKILQGRLLVLDSQTRKVAVGVSNGAVLKSNQLILESEALSTEQRQEDIRAALRGLSRELSLLTGLHVDTATQFLISQAAITSQPLNRPELRSFEAEKQVWDLRSQLLKKQIRPQLYLFGEGDFGRPGYNFLNTDPRLYGIAGLGLSWNINQLFTHQRQQKLIDINREIVKTKEATFRTNLQAALEEKRAEIEKYQIIIDKDDAILEKRKEILAAAASQLNNGVITSTDYLAELNARDAAELNLSLHRIQLAMAQQQYNTLSGY